MLQPAGHIDRLITEAVTESAQLQAADDRADLARQIGLNVVTGLVEVLVAAGVLTPKGR